MGRRKGGVGKNWGDSFDKRIGNVPDINSIKPGNRFSFRAPKPNPDLRQLDDACGFNEINTQNDLLDNRGRQMGDSVQYDPVQLKNYLSQYSRYERAINLKIDRIRQDSRGRTVYGFCSKNSPTGFWEVSLASGTYINIPNPVLLVICPRPFSAWDLTGQITSDGDNFRWTQLQGRLTGVYPSEGGTEALNPIINIVGIPNQYDPPIQLVIEMVDNPQAFGILQITTTPTSNDYGEDIQSSGNSLRVCTKPTVTAFVPTRSSGASIYAGETLPVTWSLPTCDTDALIQTVWTQNTTGQYVPVGYYSPSSDRIATASPNNWYSVRADFNLLGNKFTSWSDRFFFKYPNNNNPIIFADDTQSGAAIATNKAAYTKYPLQVVSQQINDPYSSSNSISANKAALTIYPLQAVTLQPTELYPSSNSIAANKATYTKYQLGGVIIG